MLGLAFDASKIDNTEKRCGGCAKILTETDSSKCEVCPALLAKLQQKADEIIKLRQRSEDLQEIRKLVDSAYEDVITGCAEFDGNAEATEEVKMLAETMAFAVLYEKITEKENEKNARIKLETADRTARERRSHSDTIQQ